ncbi:MAG: hypothetical protein DWI22_14120, partial [Planctomycetota bacterium]
MTLNQVRRNMASIIRVTYECDSPRVVNHRTTQQLERNQLAKLYHWQRHKKRPPKNLDRRRIEYSRNSALSRLNFRGRRTSSPSTKVTADGLEVRRTNTMQPEL